MFFRYFLCRNGKAVRMNCSEYGFYWNEVTQKCDTKMCDLDLQ